MKQYKVYKNPMGSVEAVKLGWSWPALFFGAIWALIKKLWLVFFGIFIYSIAIVVIVNIINKNADLTNLLINIGNVAISVFLGLNGNSLREKNLISRGFKQVGGVVNASSPEGAIALAIP